MKRPPFHEVVKRELCLLTALAGLGIQLNQRKQGRIEAALTLITDSEIPKAAIPEVLKTCEEAKELMAVALRDTKGLNRSGLILMIEFADATIDNLKARLEEPADAEPASAG